MPRDRHTQQADSGRSAPSQRGVGLFGATFEFALDLSASARDLCLAAFWSVVGVAALEFGVRADQPVGYLGALAVFFALGLTRDTHLYRHRPYLFAAVCALAGLAEVAFGAASSDSAAYVLGALTLGWGAYDAVSRRRSAT